MVNAALIHHTSHITHHTSHSLSILEFPSINRPVRHASFGETVGLNVTCESIIQRVGGDKMKKNNLSSLPGAFCYTFLKHHTTNHKSHITNHSSQITHHLALSTVFQSPTPGIQPSTPHAYHHQLNKAASRFCFKAD